MPEPMGPRPDHEMTRGRYGFNSKKQLAMSVWLSVPNYLREEYVAVVIEEES